MAWFNIRGLKDFLKVTHFLIQKTTAQRKQEAENRNFMII